MKKDIIKKKTRTQYDYFPKDAFYLLNMNPYKRMKKRVYKTSKSVLKEVIKKLIK